MSPPPRSAFAAGGGHPAVLNAANEAAVMLFLNKRIAFMDIPRLIEGALSRQRSLPDDAGAEELLALDAETRRAVIDRVDAGLS